LIESQRAAGAAWAQAEPGMAANPAPAARERSAAVVTADQRLVMHINVEMGSNGAVGASKLRVHACVEPGARDWSRTADGLGG